MRMIATIIAKLIYFHSSKQESYLDWNVRNVAASTAHNSERTTANVDIRDTNHLCRSHRQPRLSYSFYQLHNDFFSFK